eukprot:4897707-Pyramimonas_sp.AAC.1
MPQPFQRAAAINYPNATLPRSWSIYGSNIYIYTDSYMYIYTCIYINININSEARIYIYIYTYIYILCFGALCYAM